MATRFEVVRQNSKIVIYRLQDISLVDAALIESAPWPDGTDEIGFVFNNKITESPALLERLPADKYHARYVYEATRNEIVVPPLPRGNNALTPVVFGDRGAVRELYVRTHEDFFVKPWKDFLNDWYFKAIDSYKASGLEASQACCFEQDGKPVSMLLLLDYSSAGGVPAGLVAWIWVDSALSPESRAAVHYRTIMWLKANSAEKLQCGIHVFNARSQKFFRKVGFHPEYLCVSRK